MDEQLGVMFDYVRNSESLRNNTLILICSDNGPEQGAGSAGPFRGFKTHLFEGGIRSSLIVWGPGLVTAEPGTVNTVSTLSAIDLVPSLLEIASIGRSNHPTEFDGENLAETLLGKSTNSRRQPLFFRRPPDRDSFYGIEDCPDLAVRDGNWKLLCEYDGSQRLLFDLEADRGESKNLAEENPEIADRLAKQVVSWHQSMPQDNGATFRTKQKK